MRKTKYKKVLKEDRKTAYIDIKSEVSLVED